MSAYVVSTDTIDYLVTAAARYQAYFSAPICSADPVVLAATPFDRFNSNPYRIDGTQHELIGAILLAQNVRSVNARYDETEPVLDYDWTPVPASIIDPIVVLNSVACLRYQSCETDDYPDTFAAYVLDTIERYAIRHLPRYDQAPWGWTRNWQLEHETAIKARITAQLAGAWRKDIR